MHYILTEIDIILMKWILGILIIIFIILETSLWFLICVVRLKFTPPYEKISESLIKKFSDL